MEIFIVNGAPCSGKSCFEDMIVDITGEDYTKKFSTIDLVKDLASQCGWDGSKTPKNRKFLSDLKDLLTEWDDVPLKDVKMKVELFKIDFSMWDLSNQGSCVFIDCREPKEIEKIKKELNATSLLIRRASAENKEASNHADAEVLDYNYDIIIENNGTLEDLQLKAQEFAKQYNLHNKKEGY